MYVLPTFVKPPHIQRSAKRRLTVFFSFKSVNIIMRLRTDLEQKALNMVQII